MGEINFTLGNFSLFGENLLCVLISSPPALSLPLPPSKWFCYFNPSKCVQWKFMGGGGGSHMVVIVGHSENS
jgi:hypothetical protein